MRIVLKHDKTVRKVVEDTAMARCIDLVPKAALGHNVIVREEMLHTAM